MQIKALVTACAALCLSPCGCVRFDDQSSWRGRTRNPNCEARCAQPGSGNDSKACPWAKHFEGKYWGWRGARMCGTENLRVEVQCDGIDHGTLVSQIRKHFGGKHTVFVGDSTMRQSYLGLLCMLWEENLIKGYDEKTSLVKENNEHEHRVEWKGMIEGSFPELGKGTKLTYVRLDWGQPGPFLMGILDTADVTVANLGMHYHHPDREESHITPDDHQVHNGSYAADVEVMLQHISRRGRPGHRAFWRESFTCAEYALQGDPAQLAFGCSRKGNTFQAMYNQIATLMPSYHSVEVLPVQDLLSDFWWSHPGQHDCCHRVNSVPGLLSATARVLVASLAHKEVQTGEVKLQRRTQHHRNGGCPRLSTVCPGNFKL